MASPTQPVLQAKPNNMKNTIGLTEAQKESRPISDYRGILTKEQNPVSGNTEDIARKFHEAYERLAPSFGYETRKASAVPWEQVPEQNKNLMIAVCSEILSGGTCAGRRKACSDTSATHTGGETQAPQSVQSGNTEKEEEWNVWKDTTQSTRDEVFGWWLGTKDDHIWIEHESVAQTLKQMHNSAITEAVAQLKKDKEAAAELLREINAWVLWEKEPLLRDEGLRAAKVAGLIDDFLHSAAAIGGQL